MEARNSFLSIRRERLAASRFVNGTCHLRCNVSVSGLREKDGFKEVVLRAPCRALDCRIMIRGSVYESRRRHTGRGRFGKVLGSCLGCRNSGVSLRS